VRRMTEREGQQRLDSPLESERGSTTIKDSVVSRIAGMAAGEVEGVRMGGSASRAAGGILESVTGSDSQKRGISVEVGRVEAAVDLTMGIEYGRNIRELAEQVRRRITERVESLTGLQITELNVTVSEIIFPEDERDGREEQRSLEEGSDYEEDRTRAQRAEEIEAGGWESGSERRGPLDEDETRELRIEDYEVDETRQIPGEDEARRERRHDE
jgi:uncharacterized alkaline shock family protein YloU